MKIINKGSFSPFIIYNNADTEKLIILKDNAGKTGIYQWTHKESGKIYIGSAINLKTRLSQYYNINYLERNKTMYICNALREHEYSAFSLSILEFIDISHLSKEDVRKLVLEREQFYINSLEPQYNILLIASSLLGFKHTEGTKKLISEALTGKNHPMFGRIEENSSMFGKNHSADTIAKMSEAKIGENNPMFGKSLSTETRAKMKEAHKGKFHSAETKAKMSITKGTTIFVYDIQGLLVNTFSSAKKAAIFLDCSPNTIFSYIKNEKLFKDKFHLSITLK